jgi:hypothetical protein
MRWVLPARVFGVTAGLVLCALGAQWLLSGMSDPPTTNFDTFVYVGLSLLVPGALLALPWSRIRPATLWYFLFIALVVTVPPSALLILVINTWSAMHGAGGWGFAVVTLLVLAWATQLAAIWSLRPSRHPAV